MAIKTELGPLGAETKIVNRQHLDYVFCVPGHPSSGIQAINLTTTILQLQAKGKSIGVFPAFSPSVYMVRNACLGQRGFSIDQKPFQGAYDYDRIVWLDSDNIAKAEHIEALTARDVPIVAGWSRQYSIGPINDDNNANCGTWQLEPRIPQVNPGKSIQKSYTVGDMAKKKDLLEVDYVGMALMVVKRGVFESLEFPWFTAWEFEWEENGKIMRNLMTEDAGFCFRAREAGYKIFVDPTVCVQHEKRVML